MVDRRIWITVALAVAFGLGITAGVVGLKARQAGAFDGTSLGRGSPPTPVPSTLVPSTLVPSTLVPSTLIPSTAAPSTLVPSTIEPTEPPSTSCAGAVDPITFVEPDAHRGPFDSLGLSVLATTPPLNEDGAPIDPTGLNIHPAGTAAFGIAYLNAGDKAMAITMARALLAAGEPEDDQLWFPYRFPFDANPWHLESGWKSGYTQGLSLAFLTRLWEKTADPTYRDAADSVFRTLIPGEGVSWLSGQDFWIEEYPTTPPDTVYNGHVYATLGLYEYDRVVGSPPARALALQGIETLRRHVSDFVMADGSAYYDAGRFQGKISANYHITYVQMFSWLAAITSEPCFLDVGRSLAGRLTRVP